MRGHAHAASLLAGRLFDDEARRLTPSHAVKCGKRYRYYVSQPLTTGPCTDVVSARRLPAGELEQVVTERLRQFVGDRGAMLAVLAGQVEAADRLEALLDRAATLSALWSALTPMDLRALVLAVVMRVTIHPNRIDVEVVTASLPRVLGSGSDGWPAAALGAGAEATSVVCLSVPSTLKRAGLGKRLIVDGSGGANRRMKPDPALISIMVKAHNFHSQLMKGGGSTLREVARVAGVTPSYFTRLLRLTYLAPDITRAIVQGSQPPTLTARVLTKASRLPLDWDEQRRLFGFA